MSVNIFKKTDDKLITVASQYKSTDIQQVKFLLNKSELPEIGEENKLYVTKSDGFMYIWNTELNKFNYVGSDSDNMLKQLNERVTDMDTDLQWKIL